MEFLRKNRDRLAVGSALACAAFLGIEALDYHNADEAPTRIEAHSRDAQDDATDSRVIEFDGNRLMRNLNLTAGGLFVTMAALYGNSIRRENNHNSETQSQQGESDET